MQNNPIRTKLEELGWEYTRTGGGCDAMICHVNPSSYFLMTTEANIPDNITDIVTIGFYQDTEWEGNGEPLFYMECQVALIIGGQLKIIAS